MQGSAADNGDGEDGILMTDDTAANKRRKVDNESEVTAAPSSEHCNIQAVSMGTEVEKNGAVSVVGQVEENADTNRKETEQGTTKSNESVEEVLQQYQEEGKSAVGSVMLMIQLSPEGVDRAALEAEVHTLGQRFVAAAHEHSLPLDSFSVQLHSGCSNAAPASASDEHVQLQTSEDESPIHTAAAVAVDETSTGDANGLITHNRVPNAQLVEHMCGLRFRISPTAFFQVNTCAAEQLYELAGSWAVQTNATEQKAVKERVLLFDVCCGTGTIGLTLARHVSKVVGIELVESAVKDANENAKLNKVCTKPAWPAWCSVQSSWHDVSIETEYKVLLLITCRLRTANLFVAAQSKRWSAPCTSICSSLSDLVRTSQQQALSSRRLQLGGRCL